MPSPATDLLAERYGRSGSSRGRRHLTVALAVTLAVVGVGWVVWSGWVHSHQEVTGQLRAYSVTGDTSTDVTVLVDRRTGAPVECDVYAQAADHSRVGERVLRIPAGQPGSVLVTVTITTQRRAVNGVLGDCVAAA
jgi:hypothetical protein